MTEHKYTIGQCCCGCTLKTGSLIIAIFSLVVNLLNLAMSIQAVTLGFYPSWVSVIVDILYSIVSVLLIIGIQQEKRNFIMVWVWTSIVVVVINLIIGVISAIGLLWINAIALFINIIILVYFIVVVRSYAISIGEGVVSPA